ncbi:alpha/beta fold hydrolase [Nocardiopsis aegyptia]|uniref:Pimeloyl-ACP methyl ester carboxylesterase n=1 Tax=Nocardiopsis aegyptia TaxID=220378 RepID=A0A7Z0JAA0_9ACTN|nr:alpha/beta hydrolase [Nocardiopsis aegyptia]NYJ34200.1 pimeloyl-ACP methyl ester carboxylesterase [Nocardiopsis aegyptia]
MRLHTYEAGNGPRTALLVHGAMSDHGTWHAVEADLVDRGYRVIGVDLRGHGRSPRGEYTVPALGQDLVDTLPTGADLAIGHSMGGLALSLAVERLGPARAVYSDPAFQFGAVTTAATDAMRSMVERATAESVRAMNPRWSDADIRAELAGFAAFDPAFFDVVTEAAAEDRLPAKAVVPSLVQLADPSFTVDADGARLLAERGFTVRVVEGAGHCVHRDDLPGFLASLDGWI